MLQQQFQIIIFSYVWLNYKQTLRNKLVFLTFKIDMCGSEFSFSNAFTCKESTDPVWNPKQAGRIFVSYESWQEFEKSADSPGLSARNRKTT